MRRVLPRRASPAGAVALLASLVSLSAGAYAVVTLAPAASASSGSPPASTRITAPRDGTLVTGNRLQIVIRTAPSVLSIGVWLENSLITSSMRRRGPGLWVGSLPRGGRVAVGVEHLLVTAPGGGFATSRFVVGRLSPRLLGVVGPSVRSAAGSAAVAIRVRGGGGNETASLNGRPLPGFTGAIAGTWSARLGADDGLRFGRNTLLFSSFDDSGSYDRERLVIVVPRTHPLVGAGGDGTATVGEVVRLGGSSSRAASRGDRLSFRWRVLSAPPGSRARLTGTSTRTPRLVPDRNGIYHVQLTVTERGRGRRSSGGDIATIDAVPADPPIGVPLETLANDHGLITIDGKPVAGTGTGGRTLSYVLLSRVDRSAPSCRGDIPASGSVPAGTAGIARLRTLVDACFDPKYMLIVSGAQGLESGAVDQFEQLIAKVGATPLTTTDRESIGSGCAFSVIGIADSPPGSAFANLNRRDVGCSGGGMSGYLQVNTAASRYGFVFPDFIPYDTRAAQSGSTSTIKIGGRSYTSQLQAGASGGFHIVVVDPRTLEPFHCCETQPFEPVPEVNFGVQTNGPDAATDRAGVAFLNDVVENQVVRDGGLMFLQSLGAPGPVAANAAEWTQLSAAIEKAGAQRTVFNEQRGGYAFVGGPDLAPGQVSTALTGQNARLTGLLVRDRSARLNPGMASTVTTVNTELPQIMYQPPEGFPQFTKGQQRANAYLARQLFGDSIEPADMRALYVDHFGDPLSEWTKRFGRLDGPLKAYPGEAACGCGQAAYEEAETQIGKEVDALTKVMGWLGRVKEVFDPTVTAFDLKEIGGRVGEQIVPPLEDKTFDGHELAIFLVDKALSLVSGGQAPSIAPALNFVIGWVAGQASGGDGEALLGAVRAKTTDLTHQLFTHYSQARSELTVMGLIMASDYGKLMTAAAKVNTGSWKLPADLEPLRVTLNKAAKTWFYAELMPIVWRVWQLPGVTNADAWTCSFSPGGSSGTQWGKPFKGQPENDQYQAVQSINPDGSLNRIVRALGRAEPFEHNRDIVGGDVRPPSPDLVNPLFKPDDGQFGTDRLGLYRQQFFEAYFPRTDLQQSGRHVCPGHT